MCVGLYIRFLFHSNCTGFDLSCNKHIPLHGDVATKILPDLCLAYISNSKAPKALSTLQIIADNYPRSISLEMSKKIMNTFMKKGTIMEIRSSARLLLKVGGLTDRDSLQLFTNSFMKSIEFVKGAVSIESLPAERRNEQDIPEVAFIGRSNVGKSSLVNMITNRKKLAFVSNTPGKTSEYNYFLARGEIGVSKQSHMFYLVDLPGVGYAEVMRAKKDDWIELLKSYTIQRQTLRGIFHLIDSRHGLLDADEECLSLLSDLPSYVKYVVVMTKVDKLVSEDKRRMSNVVNKIRLEIAKFNVNAEVPILFTSSESKGGGSSVWSAMLDVLHQEQPFDFSSLQVPKERQP